MKFDAKHHAALGAAVWPIYALVSTTAAACYLNSLGGEFVHDDIPAVVFNRDVIAAHPVLDTLRNDFWGTPMADPHSHKSYRPLTTLTFRINFLLFGLTPFWFHLTNVLLHATASALFARACLEVVRLEAQFATLAGLLFAVHPIHTEAVTGIVGRADVLAGVLFLASLLAYNQASLQSSQEIWTWLHIVCGALSMLAKETGITVFLVNFVFDLYKTYPRLKADFVDVRWTRDTKRFLRRSALNLTSFGVLVALRLCILQGSLPTFSEQDNPAAFHSSKLVRTMTFCYLAAFNWWLLLCPATLSHDWQMGSVPLVTSPEDSRNLLTCVGLMLVLLLVARSALDFEHHESAPIILGVSMLLLPFLPATNLFVTVGFVIAERILYIPSMGCILLIVIGIRHMWRAYQRHRQTIVSCVLLILMCQSLRCLIRNRDWLSRECLLRAGIATLPHNAKMHYNYANFLRDSTHYELAMAHYYSALRLWPTYASAHNNLGTLLKDPQEAEMHFKLAIRFSKDHLNAHYNLGKMYRHANTTKANEMLQKCLSIDANFKPAFVELCRMHKSKEPQNLNIHKLLKNIVLINSNDHEYLKLYARWLLIQGNAKLALKYLLLSEAQSKQCYEAIIKAMQLLRRFGDNGRLFQIITRYQAIRRLSAGFTSTNNNVYLQSWHLNFQVRNNAMVYKNELNISLDKKNHTLYTHSIL